MPGNLFKRTHGVACAVCPVAQLKRRFDTKMPSAIALRMRCANSARGDIMSRCLEFQAGDARFELVRRRLLPVVEAFLRLSASTAPTYSRYATTHSLVAFSRRSPAWRNPRNSRSIDCDTRAPTVQPDLVGPGNAVCAKNGTRAHIPLSGISPGWRANLARDGVLLSSITAHL